MVIRRSLSGVFGADAGVDAGHDVAVVPDKKPAGASAIWHHAVSVDAAVSTNFNALYAVVAAYCAADRKLDMAGDGRHGVAPFVWFRQ